MIIDYKDRLEQLFNEKETDFFIPPSKKVIDNTIFVLSNLKTKYKSLKNLTIDATSYGTIVLEWRGNNLNFLSYEIDRLDYKYIFKKNEEYQSGVDNNIDIEYIIKDLDILK
jgi:hypothetical protein